MRERASLVVLAFLAVLAGGGWGGILPSQWYVSWALAGTVTPSSEVQHEEETNVPKGFREKPKPYRVDYGQMAYRAAVKAHIKRPQLFVRQIAAESSFNPCIGSPAGAVGIAQIMPNTSVSWHVDPYDPEQALNAAAKHMRVYEKYYDSYSVALAAYNAGTGAVHKFRGIPPFPETKAYVRKIMGNEDISGLHHEVFSLPDGLTPAFHARLTSLIDDVRKHGGHISIRSGFRGYSEQEALWNQRKRQLGGWRAAKRWAAPPGCSAHNLGIAADLSGDLALAHRLAAKHGLSFPLPWEDWHIQLP